MKKISKENLKTELDNYIGECGQDYELIGNCPFVVKYINSGRSYFIDELGNIKEYIDISKYVNVGDYVDYNPTIIDKFGTPVNSNKLTYNSYTGTTTESGNGYISPERYGTQTYTATSDVKWRIFDIENGVIKLISETPIYKSQGVETFILNGARGYLYAESELARICSIYGYGYGANTNLDTIFKYGGPFDEQEGKIKIQVQGVLLLKI